MKNHILIRLVDSSDDLLVNVELHNGFTRFRADTYLTESALKTIGADIALFLSTTRSPGHQRSHTIQLGPPLPGSPNVKLQVELLPSGNAAAIIEMRSITHGQDKTRIDSCLAHLWTDLASLDRFSDELNAMAARPGTAAALYCFENFP